MAPPSNLIESSDFAIRPRSKRKKADCGSCKDCGDVLSNENWTPFHQKYGRYICRICFQLKQRKYRTNNPNHNEHRNKMQREKRKEMSEWDDEKKALHSRIIYGYKLRRKYGITIEDYDSMLDSQGRKCSICLSSEPRGNGSFHVDHCHDTGKVRSLLCAPCNMMLGFSKDNPDLLRKAARYIEDHRLENRRKEGGKAF